MSATYDPHEQFAHVRISELAQLREKATEYDRIADLIDPYRAYDKSIHDQIVDLLHDDTSKEYPEIDALRARLEELESDHSLLTKRLEAVIFDRDDYAEQVTQSKIGVVRANERIAEQARQLEAARNLIIRSGRVINNLKKPDSVYDLTSDLLDWLAANPAPQEQQP